MTGPGRFVPLLGKLVVEQRRHRGGLLGRAGGQPDHLARSEPPADDQGPCRLAAPRAGQQGHDPRPLPVRRACAPPPAPSWAWSCPGNFTPAWWTPVVLQRARRLAT